MHQGNMMGYETKETDLLLGRFVKWLIIIKCHYQNDDLALIFITIGNHLFSRMYLQCWDFFLKFFSALPSIDFNELKLFHRQSGTALIIVWLINKLCPGIFFFIFMSNMDTGHIQNAAEKKPGLYLLY